jgi:hypothetical protein
MNGQSNTPVLAAAPWYTSPVYIGVVISILSQLFVVMPKVFAAVGITSTDKIGPVVEDCFQGVAIVAAWYAQHARRTSTVAPLTLSAASAAVHPNTTAAAAQVVTTK